MKYILAVFLAAAFFMTGCSSDSSDGLMNDGYDKNYKSTNGFDPTYGTGLNGSYDLTGLPSDSSARDMLPGNNGITDSNGGLTGGNLTGNNGGMASTTNTGTNY